MKPHDTFLSLLLLMILGFSACSKEDNPNENNSTSCMFDSVNFSGAYFYSNYAPEATYSDLALSTNQHYLLAGTSTDTALDEQAIFRKFAMSDPINDQILVEFGGSGEDRGAFVEELADGSFLFGGTTTTGGNAQDFFLNQYSSTGTLLWSQTYGGSSDEVMTGAIRTSTNQIVLYGFTESFGQGSRDAYVVNVNIDGSENWSQTYGTANQDGAMSVAEGNGVLAIFAFIEDNGPNDRNLWLLEVDPSSGNLQNNAIYGSTEYEEPQALIYLENEGHYILAGHTAGTDASHNTWVARIDENLDTIWTTEIGEPGVHDGGQGLVFANNALYVISQSASFYGEDNSMISRVELDGTITDFELPNEPKPQTPKEILVDGAYLLVMGNTQNAQDRYGFFFHRLLPF